MRWPWLLLLLATLPGCGGTPDPRTQITLQRFFGACDAQYGRSTDVAKAEGECGIITTLVNKFEADNPDIAVKTNIVFWPGYDQLTAQLAANDEPDLVTMHVSVLPDFQARGLLTPIGGELVAAGIDPARFTPAAARAVTLGGRIYGLPFDNWAPLWHINMNEFRRAGLVRNGKPILPRNGPELLRQAEQFKRATGKPYLVQISANEYATYARNLYTFLMQQDARFFADPKRIRLRTPEAKAYLSLFKEIRDRGLTTRNQDYSAATASFLNGGGGVLLTGNWMVGAFDLESKSKGKPLSNGYAVAPYPQLFGASPARYVDGHVWVMPTNPRRTPAQRAAVLRLMRFLADHEADWARTGHLPTFTDVIASPRFTTLPHRANYAALTRVGAPLPAGVRRQYPIETIIGEESAAAINGNKTIDRALADAERRINDLLDNI
ncbi:extracellular solute-binding protein [Sphingomonas sp.]|jgi:multiple sugar transport system substrate-binding protein|uniref:extracellular solute-binding protein n=1 Tax=Sphingomonas sp. TaxID=28214 RepID=UPI002D7F5978|nr:extracellular solute-binding protein [Sphingomonas sp.]HEU0045895.1 extracellular solute-binding protein [Sphingomonas sp.]